MLEELEIFPELCLLVSNPWLRLLDSWRSVNIGSYAFPSLTTEGKGVTLSVSGHATLPPAGVGEDLEPSG